MVLFTADNYELCISDVCILMHPSLARSARIAALDGNTVSCCCQSL